MCHAQITQRTYRVCRPGCGVIGLSTARLFQRRGFTVTIYTKDTPPNTTSNIAGGWWAPVTLFEPGRQGSTFSTQYVRAAKFAHRYYQNPMTTTACAGCPCIC